jgi:hypothetical protein
VALALMAADVAGRTAYEAAENGANPQQALVLATIAGAAEVVTEAIPIGTLTNVLKKGAKTFGQLLKNVAVQAGEEGLQELVTEYVGVLSEQAVLGDQSEFNQHVSYLMSQGASEEDATRQAVGQYYILNPLLSFAGGVLAGGAMAGGASVIGGRYHSNTDVSVETEASTSRPDNAGMPARMATDGLEGVPSEFDALPSAREVMANLTKEDAEAVTQSIIDDTVGAMQNAKTGNLSVENAPGAGYNNVQGDTVQGVPKAQNTEDGIDVETDWYSEYGEDGGYPTTAGAGNFNRLLKQSTCSSDDFYKYLNKINSDYAHTYVKTG